MAGLEVLLAPSMQPLCPSEGGLHAQCGCLAQMSSLQHFALAASTALYFNPTKLGLLALRAWCKSQFFSFQMNENDMLKVRLATALSWKAIMNDSQEKQRLSKHQQKATHLFIHITWENMV